MSIFPFMSRFSNNSNNLLEKAHEASFRFMLMISLPIAVFVTVFSKNIILLIYKDEFLQSSLALSILIWSVVFLFFNMLFANLLVAVGKEKVTAYTTGILAMVNIILNYILIPQYSYIGASIATVFTAFLGTAIYVYYIYRNLIKRLYLTTVLKLIILNALLYAILTTFMYIPIIPLIIISVTIYIVLLVLSKSIKKEEILLLKLTKTNRG